MLTYTPAIKAKANDIAALSLLSEQAKRHIKPLLEVPISVSGMKVETQIAESVAALSAKMPNIDYYFDPLGIASGPDQVSAFEALAQNCKNFTPTIGLGRGPIAIRPLRELLDRHRLGICIRLEHTDLDDAGEDTWAHLLQLSADLGIDPRHLDLVVDYRHLGKYDLNRLKDQVLDFFALQPKRTTIGQVTLLGSSALESVAAVAKDGVKLVERRELQLWGAVQFELGDSRTIRYGDYGIVNPEFVFSGPNPNANAKIRYTTGSQIAYFRGQGLYKPSRFDQYHDLARKVIESGMYLGKDFSYGDNEIDRCARHQCGPGNLATWIKIDSNHHAELTARQTVALSSEIANVSQTSEVGELIASLE